MQQAEETRSERRAGARRRGGKRVVLAGAVLALVLAVGGSVAGYRVKEVLLGQDVEAVGRTSAVTGELTVSGTQVERGAFTVDPTRLQEESRPG